MAGKLLGKIFQHIKKRQSGQFVIVLTAAGMGGQAQGATTRQEPGIGADTRPAYAQAFADLTKAEFFAFRQQKADDAPGDARAAIFLGNEPELFDNCSTAVTLHLLFRSVLTEQTKLGKA